MPAGTKSSKLKCSAVQKVIASAIAICFLVNSICYGQIPSAIRLQPIPQIQIPSYLGSIEAANFSASSERPFLIHIQDAHANSEGQRNIAEIVRYLAKTYGIRKVFVEGAVENLDSKYLQFISDKNLNQKLIQKLVDLGEVTGAELALGTKGIQFIGIEDVSLYRKNFDLFRDVMSRDKASQRSLKALQKKLDQKASRILTKDSLLLFRQYLDFDKKSQNWTAVTSDLNRLAKQNLARDFSSPKEQIEFSNLVRLYQLKAEEGKINFEKAQAEEKEIKHKYGNFSGTGFRAQMENLYQKATPLGFKFKSYPHFTSRIRNQIFQQEIEAAPLFDEIKRLMDLLLTKMVPEELIREARNFKLLEGLLNLELTREEWEAGKSTQFEDSGTSIAKHFYETAIQRESVFLNKIEKSLGKSKDVRAIVITGGFHTGGMTRIFDQRQISHLTIRPKVKSDSSKLYRQGMMRGIKTSEVVLAQLAQSRRALAASLGEQAVAERMKTIAIEASSLGEVEVKTVESASQDFVIPQKAEDLLNSLGGIGLKKLFQDATQAMRYTEEERPLDSRGKPGAVLNIQSGKNLMVVGDLQGHFYHLTALLKEPEVMEGLRDGTLHLAFLGDLIHPSGDLMTQNDAVPQTLATLALFAQLKIRFPGNVHTILGNHELSHVPGSGVSSYKIPPKGKKKDRVNQNRQLNDYVLEEYGRHPLSGIGLLGEMGNFFASLPLMIRVKAGNDFLMLLHAQPPIVSGGLKELNDALVKGYYYPDNGVIRRVVFSRRLRTTTQERFLKKYNFAAILSGHTPPANLQPRKNIYGLMKNGRFGVFGIGNLILDAQARPDFGYVVIGLNNDLPRRKDGKLAIEMMKDSEGKSAFRAAGTNGHSLGKQFSKNIFIAAVLSVTAACFSTDSVVQPPKQQAVAVQTAPEMPRSPPKNKTEVIAYLRYLLTEISDDYLRANARKFVDLLEKKGIVDFGLPEKRSGASTFELAGFELDQDGNPKSVHLQAGGLFYPAKIFDIAALIHEGSHLANLILVRESGKSIKAAIARGHEIEKELGPNAGAVEAVSDAKYLTHFKRFWFLKLHEEYLAQQASYRYLISVLPANSDLEKYLDELNQSEDFNRLIRIMYRSLTKDKNDETKAKRDLVDIYSHDPRSKKLVYFLWTYEEKGEGRGTIKFMVDEENNPYVFPVNLPRYLDWTVQDMALRQESDHILLFASGKSLGTDSNALSQNEQLAIVGMAFHGLNTWLVNIHSSGMLPSTYVYGGKFEEACLGIPKEKYEKAHRSLEMLSRKFHRLIDPDRVGFKPQKGVDRYFAKIWGMLLLMKKLIQYHSAVVKNLSKKISLTDEERFIKSQLEVNLSLEGKIDVLMKMIKPSKRVPSDDNKIFDIRKIIGVAEELFKDSGALKSYQIDLVLPKEELPVRVSALGMVFVFENLIRNAKKHNASVITIEAFRDLRTDKVVITVSNNGRPISSERIKKLFKEGESEDKNRPEGGMGLVLSKALLKSYGGDMDLLSQADQSPVFRIELPYAHVSAASLGKLSEEGTLPGKIKLQIVPDKKALAKEVARRIVEVVKKNPRAVLGLATGGTMEDVYREVIELFKSDTKINFSEAVTFNLDEYLGLAPKHPQSYRAYMEKHFFGPLREKHWDEAFQKENTFVFDGLTENPQREIDRYLREIKKRGGIDFQLLGIGKDGHFAFVEPAPKPDTLEKIRDFNEFMLDEDVPEQELSKLIIQVLEKRLKARSELAVFPDLLKQLEESRKQFFALKGAGSEANIYDLKAELNIFGRRLLEQQDTVFYISNFSEAKAQSILEQIPEILRKNVAIKDRAEFSGAGAKLVSLAIPTLLDNGRYFENVNAMKLKALTLAGEVRQAREIVLAATGEKKAEAIRDSLIGPISSEVTSSIFQLNDNTTFIVDPAAASLIPEGAGAKTQNQIGAASLGVEPKWVPARNDSKPNGEELYDSGLVEALMKISHPSIPKFRKREQGDGYEIKWIEGRRWIDWIDETSQMSEKEFLKQIVGWTIQIGEALKLVDDAGYIHGDVRIENVMIEHEKNNPVLIDWDDPEFRPEQNKLKELITDSIKFRDQYLGNKENLLDEELKALLKNDRLNLEEFVSELKKYSDRKWAEGSSLGTQSRTNEFLSHAQSFIDFISMKQPQMGATDNPDVFLLLGNPDIRSFIEFAKHWKKLQSQGILIPIVAAGGRGRGTPGTVANLEKHYGEEMTDSEKQTLSGAAISEGEIMRWILVKEGIRPDFIQIETKSTNTPQNFVNSTSIVKAIADKRTNRERPFKIQTVTNPPLNLRAHQTGLKKWENEIKHQNWELVTQPIYDLNLHSLSAKEIFELLEYVLGNPKDVPATSNPKKSSEIERVIEYGSKADPDVVLKDFTNSEWTPERVASFRENEYRNFITQNIYAASLGNDHPYEAIIPVAVEVTNKIFAENDVALFRDVLYVLLGISAAHADVQSPVMVAPGISADQLAHHLIRSVIPQSLPDGPVAIVVTESIKEDYVKALKDVIQEGDLIVAIDNPTTADDILPLLRSITRGKKVIVKSLVTASPLAAELEMKLKGYSQRFSLEELNDSIAVPATKKELIHFEVNQKLLSDHQINIHVVNSLLRRLAQVKDAATRRQIFEQAGLQRIDDQHWIVGEGIVQVIEKLQAELVQAHSLGRSA